MGSRSRGRRDAHDWGGDGDGDGLGGLACWSVRLRLLISQT